MAESKGYSHLLLVQSEDPSSPAKIYLARGNAGHEMNGKEK